MSQEATEDFLKNKIEEQGVEEEADCGEDKGTES